MLHTTEGSALKVETVVHQFKRGIRGQHRHDIYETGSKTWIAPRWLRNLAFCHMKIERGEMTT
jgi:hypothetical protein